MLFLAMAILSASCASRVSHEELLAAAQGSGEAVKSNDALAAGDQQATVSDAPLVDGAATTATTLASGTITGGGTLTTSPATGTATAAARCTTPRETLTIGAVGEQSGIFGPVIGGTVKAVQAWVASVNATGGINCHPLRYIIKDDRGDPSTHQAQVRELVEQENVVAFVMMDAPIPGRSSVQYLTQKGVPVIGTAGGEDWYYDSPVFRPQMTTGTRALEGIIHMLSKVGPPKGKTRLGTITCVEVDLCASLYRNADRLAKQVGLQLVFQAQTSILAPSDYRGPCQQAKDANVEMFFLGADTNSIQRILAACDSVGFHPIYASGGILVTKELVSDPRAVGFLIAPSTPLYTDMSIPSIVDMHRVMKKYLPGYAVNAPVAVGWAAAMLFQKILERTPEPVTREGILRAAGTIKNDNLGGLGPELSFTFGQNAPPTTCYWAGRVSADKSFEPVPELGNKRFCVG